MASTKQRQNRHALDFQAQAKDRREAPIKLPDGAVFHRRVKDNALSREARRLGGESQEELLTAEQLREEAAGMERGDARKAKREQAEEAEDAGLGLLYDLAAVLIVDGDGNPPDADRLREAGLEIDQVNELVGALLGGEESTDDTPTVTEA